MSKPVDEPIPPDWEDDEEGRALDAAIGHAVRKALEEKARDGACAVVWRNGRVEWVPAADILRESNVKLDGH